MADDVELRINDELKKINETLRNCKIVEETVNTQGWKEVIEPLLDKMVNDILGAKTNGKWYGGLLNNSLKSDTREFYIGYKQALIDLHSRIYAYNDNVKVYEDKKELLINKTQQKFKRPLIDDTRY